MAYEYNALIKEGLQKKTAGAFPSGVVATVDEVNSLQGVTGNVQTQLNELHSDSKDIDVSTLEEFNAAIASASATNSIRVHLRANISLTSNASYNLNYVQVIGHDFTLNLNNYTFTITGQTCSFYQIRIAATLTTTAESAGDYENARIIINSNVASSRFFFEYVVFRNFINYANEVNDIIWVSNISGSSPSLHLYFMFTEVMTNYQDENINSGVWCVNNISNRLHALTVHNIDFWGPAPGENDKTINFAFRGFSLSGAAKLAYIQDGSSVLNTTVSEALTPNFINQYNPGFAEYTENVTNSFESTRSVLKSESLLDAIFNYSYNFFKNFKKMRCGITLKTTTAIPTETIITPCSSGWLTAYSPSNQFFITFSLDPEAHRLGMPIFFVDINTHLTYPAILIDSNSLMSIRFYVAIPANATLNCYFECRISDVKTVTNNKKNTTKDIY